MPEAAVSTTRVQVRALCKSYETAAGPLVVLDGIDLDLRGGEAVAVTGPSGSGKSTLLHILGGLDFGTSGTVEVDGRQLDTLTPVALAEYRNRCVGFVFQDHHLLPQCTVMENVLLPCLASGGASGDRMERARWLLERVGLSARLGHRPSELSGGEKQRVAIARAMIQEPKLLLCDEPTGNLDRSRAEAIAELLEELAKESRAVLLVVTHSLDLAGRLPGRYELVEGRLRSLSG